MYSKITSCALPEKSSVSIEDKKIPISVLVVIYSPSQKFLLLERADRPGYWQSVTGSLDSLDEQPIAAAVRELSEETGLIVKADKQCPGLMDLLNDQCFQYDLLRAWPYKTEYEILAHWRHRYPDGIAYNTEHWFFVCVPEESAIQLNPREHLQYSWLDYEQASSVCFSPSNAAAIKNLSQHLFN